MYIKNKRLILPVVSSILISVFNLSLLFIPLFNVFGYEFSFANSIFLSFLSGIVFILVSRNGSLTEIKNEIVSNKKFYFLLLAVFTILPLSISLIHSLFSQMCSFSQGLLFYLFFTIPSIFIGMAIGYFSLFLFRRFAILTFVLLYFAILSIALFEFYFNPQIYFYNPIFSYYPGTIYDEALVFTSHMLFYRLLNSAYFILGVSFLHFFLIRGKKSSSSVVFAIWVFIGLLFIYEASWLGYATNKNYLKKNLSKISETEHFKIHFYSDISHKDKLLISSLHEYYFLQVSSYFKLSKKGNSKIESFVFESSRQKQRLLGSKNADIAKPWLNQIYITKTSVYSTLKHEIAHCLAGDFGATIFKISGNFNPALIEGIAVAAAPILDEKAVDYYVLLAKQNGIKIDIPELFSNLSFFSQLSIISYTYAGSFTKYLIEKYGVEPFKLLYSGEEFEEVYPSDLNEESNDYFKYLDSKEYIFTEHNFNYYFGRETIFNKICPRILAKKLDEAFAYFNEKKLNESAEEFQKILELSPGYSSIIGLSKIYLSQKKYSESLKILKSFLPKFKKTPGEYLIKLFLADSYFLTNDTSKADSVYNLLAEENPNENLLNTALLRVYLLENYREKLSYYLTGDDSIKISILEEINSDKIFYPSIPVLLNIMQGSKKNYTELIDKISGNLQVNNFYSSYAALKLSQYYLNNFRLTQAKKMAELSLYTQIPEKYKQYFKDNIEMINWLINNSFII